MTVPTTATSAATAGATDRRRWLVLAVIAVAQLMIVVDASIVDIALPSAQKALGFSNVDRQWVVTAYTLAFGGLLLLGGRIADYGGRKRILLVGLIGFAASSAIGGLAVDAGMLFAARAVQGAFAALLAPAALSLLSVTFTDPVERARAFGVYGAIAGGGLAIGLIGGGVLTEYATWRWCLLVNTPIAVAAAIAGARLIRESRAERTGHYDLPGALVATAGLVSLVYGFTEADTSGWSAPLTLALLGAAVVLLVGFVVLEHRNPNALLPLRVVTERNRAGAFLSSLLVGMALFGTFLFLTYYLQISLGYSALRTGFAFLPLSVGVVVSAMIASALMPRVSPRWIMASGLLLAGAGLLWFTQLGTSSAYLVHVLPAEIVTSFGLGLVFVPISSTSLVGITSADAGVASAVMNTTQQVGGSIGTALLNTIATTATAGYVAAHGLRSLAAGTVHGYDIAFSFGAGGVVLALILAVALINARKEDIAAGEALPALG